MVSHPAALAYGSTLFYRVHFYFFYMCTFDPDADNMPSSQWFPGVHFWSCFTLRYAVCLYRFFAYSVSLRFGLVHWTSLPCFDLLMHGCWHSVGISLSPLGMKQYLPAWH